MKVQVKKYLSQFYELTRYNYLKFANSLAEAIYKHMEFDTKIFFT